MRFTFIDRFRGMIGVMMALGHSNYYFNAAWLSLDPLDPFFDNTGQFWLRYMGYLCAPGFLAMNGAMVYWAYKRRITHGLSHAQASWELIQRGLFLIVMQLVWVNSSWSGLARLRLAHFGIIATIGTSMILLTLIVRWKWWQRAILAAALFIGQPFLLKISYDIDGPWHYLNQFLFDAGDFNKYPILPWFALAVVGSIMAHFWFERWQTDSERANKSMLIGLGLTALALIVRLGNGFGNLFETGDFMSWSFMLVQKYPPTLVHQLWLSGAVIFFVGLMCRIGIHSNIFAFLGIVGKVPLFFYAVHIPLLAIFAKRMGYFYREGAVKESLIGWVILVAIMLPLAYGFAKVKKKYRKNWFIRMI
ncbi:MAG: DUF1624 domain-containing protein [bacterium]|nr:DUF1624 domain-containing protein [bacterium]MCP4799666.1 DUF1624 domain-containing protein [bacterium]